MDGVYMDTSAVRDMAKSFSIIGEVLGAVSKALQGLAMVLKTTAFIGLVGGTAVLMFIERIQPPMQQLSEKCEEISKDLDASVTAYENGDELGSTRFH